MASVGEVPDMTGQVESIRSGHLVDPPYSTVHLGIEKGALSVLSANSR